MTMWWWCCCGLLPLPAANCVAFAGKRLNCTQLIETLRLPRCRKMPVYITGVGCVRCSMRRIRQRHIALTVNGSTPWGMNGAGHITLLCALLHNTLAYSPTGSGHILLRSPNAMRCAQRKQRNVFIYVVQARDWRLMGLLRVLAQRMFWPKKVFCFSSLAVFVQRSHKKCTAHESYTYHPFFVLVSFFCVSFSIAQQ